MFVYSNWKTQPKRHIRKKNNISEASNTVEDVALHISVLFQRCFRKMLQLMYFSRNRTTRKSITAAFLF